MSVFRLFEVLKVKTEFEAEEQIFSDVLDVEDVQEWAKATHEATGCKLKGINSCDSVDDAIYYLECVLDEELAKEVRETGATPELINIASAFYEYNFRAFSKGFLNDDDFEDYLETLAQFLPAPELLPKPDKFAIRRAYWELVEAQIWDSFKGYKLDIIEKFRIIGAFVESYEGYNPQSEEFLRECSHSEKIPIFRDYFENETLGELMEAISYHMYWFWFVDDYGEPTLEKPHPPVYYLGDCLKWRRV